MKPKQVRIQLHPAQKQFRSSSALFRGFTGGRGAGKSWVGAYDMIVRAKPGRTYMVVAPTYPMLQDASMRSFLSIARDLGVLDEAHVKKAPPPSCKLLTGAEILFRSADDPEKLRGPNLSGCWMDEASLMHKDAYDIAIACLREGGEAGFLSATFTPKGYSHWTYDRFGTGRPDTALFRASTWENPFNPKGFADTLQLQYGEGSFSLQELGGQFVEDDDAWQVIPSAWVRAAQARWTDKPPEGQALTCVGVDVAHGGSDSTVVSARYGPWFAPLKRYQGECTDTGEKAAHLVLREIPAGSDAPVNVDAIGYGAPCVEELRKLIGRKRANAINVASAPDPAVFDKTKKYKMVNLRAAMFWKLREALDPVTGDGLMLPPDQELLADLSAAHFEVRSSGIIVEPKIKIKDRLGRSPDRADAIALAHWQVKLWKLTADSFYV